jgi:arylsulfatase A-like enzyme
VCQISPKEFGQIIPKVSDLANHAIDWIHRIHRTKEIEPDRPFFCYVAPAATHAPHHAPKAWIDKFKGQFDEGWDKYRELTLARQKKLGVVPQDTVLSKRPDSLPAWDTHHAKNAGEVFG